MSRQRVLWPLALGLLASPLLAQAQAEPTPVGTWRFQATPYVWMSGLQGNVQPAAAGATGGGGHVVFRADGQPGRGGLVHRHRRS